MWQKFELRSPRAKVIEALGFCTCEPHLPTLYAALRIKSPSSALPAVPGGKAPMERLPGRPKPFITGRQLAVLGLAAWVVLVAAQIVTPLWYPTPDACNYLSIARSIATQGTVTRLGDRNPMYGLGYPLLVSP